MKMATRYRNPPWTDLPQELLYAIANSLTPNPINILAFRSVCNSWRSSFPRLTHPSLLSPHLPLSVPNPPFSYYGWRRTSFLTVTVIYALFRPPESSCTPVSCILFLDECNAGKVSVRRPFLSASSKSFPVNFPKTLNLIDFNARELGRFYNLRFSTMYNDNQYWAGDVDKVVLFPNGLAAVAIVDHGKLAMIRLNLGSNEAGFSPINEWEIYEITHDGKGVLFDDIIGFKGKVLGIDRKGSVYEIDYNSYKINLGIPSIAGGVGRRKRLVESLETVYLVFRGKVKTSKRTRIDFKVYKLDEGRKKWVEIRSIGDRSFFFGSNFSFSASARELGNCATNAIVFRWKSFGCYRSEYEEECCESESSGLNFIVRHFRGGSRFRVTGSYPDYLDILWPPPPWITPVDRPTLKRKTREGSQVEENGE